MICVQRPYDLRLKVQEVASTNSYPRPFDWLLTAAQDLRAAAMPKDLPKPGNVGRGAWLQLRFCRTASSGRQHRAHAQVMHPIATLQ